MDNIEQLTKTKTLSNNESFNRIILTFQKMGLFLDANLHDLFSTEQLNSFLDFCIKNTAIFQKSDFLIITRNVISLFLYDKNKLLTYIRDINWRDYDSALVENELGNHNKILKKFEDLLIKNTFENKESVLESKKSNILSDLNKQKLKDVFIEQQKESNIDQEKTHNLLSNVLDIEHGTNVTSRIIESTKNNSSLNTNPKDNEISKTTYVLEKIKNNYPKQGNSVFKLNDQSSELHEEKTKLILDPIEKLNKNKNLKGNIKILYSYDDVYEKKNVSDFVSYYNQRYMAISKLLRKRDKLADALPISRLSSVDKTEVAVTGIVSDISQNKNSIVVTLEDPTGLIKVIFSENKKDVYDVAKELVFDEVIGVRGVISKKWSKSNLFLFPTEIYQPDVLYRSHLKKSPYDGYAVFLSDLHIGSTKFLADDFKKFIRWINGESSDLKQRKIAESVKYIFILGDLVDGIGVYPSQESELTIKDIKKQYDECAAYLSKIPTNIPLIIIPGNHDAVRLEEPQPALNKDFARSIWELPNSIILTNPSMVSIDSTDDFDGIKVLLYHGYSFDYYVANVDHIRTQGGYDRADLIMKFLIKRRHLAPSYGSTVYIPDKRFDPLFIKDVPDIFATGHIHKTSVSNYKGITMLSGSCWQDRTSFQEKVGHHPEPSRVPIINLNTREVTILNFGN